jgi:hypothetical protein
LRSGPKTFSRGAKRGERHRNTPPNESRVTLRWEKEDEVVSEITRHERVYKVHEIEVLELRECK